MDRAAVGDSATTSTVPWCRIEKYSPISPDASAVCLCRTCETECWPQHPQFLVSETIEKVNLDAPKSEPCFRVALEVARTLEAKWWELCTTITFSRLLASEGRRDEARGDVYQHVRLVHRGLRYCRFDGCQSAPRRAKCVVRRPSPLRLGWDQI